MRNTLFIYLFFLTSLNVIAQVETDQSADNERPATLEERFNQIKNEAESFKQYKLIDRNTLDSFWKTTMDSVNALKNEVELLKKEIDTKNSSINDLETSIADKDSQIEELEGQTSSIEVFGIDMLKSTFIFFSFFISGILILALIFLMYKFKDNNNVAKAKINDYNKLNDEFENYKRNALEKQMKLRRDLQTAQNKLEETRK